MRLAADIERLTAGIRALRTVRALIREGVNVGKLSSLAERIRDTKTRLDIEADGLHEALNVIDKAAPIAFERGHRYIASQAAEIAEIEDTLRELSNLGPNEPAPSPRDSPPDPNAARRAAAGLAPLTAPAPETAQAGTADESGDRRPPTPITVDSVRATTGLATHRSFPAATVSRAFGE